MVTIQAIGPSSNDVRVQWQSDVQAFSTSTLRVASSVSALASPSTRRTINAENPLPDTTFLASYSDAGPADLLPSTIYYVQCECDGVLSSVGHFITSGTPMAISPVAHVALASGVWSANITWADPSGMNGLATSGVVTWSSIQTNLTNRDSESIPVASHNVGLVSTPVLKNTQYFYSGASLDSVTGIQYAQSSEQSFITFEAPPGIFIYSPQYQNSRPIGFWGTGSS